MVENMLLVRYIRYCIFTGSGALYYFVVEISITTTTNTMTLTKIKNSPHSIFLPVLKI